MGLFYFVGCLFSIALISCSHAPEFEKYPENWWRAIEDKKSWEISPDSVSPPQVILSKRNELGLLSNFAPTPFELAGRKFASLEGFWQAMKYPEDRHDPRSSLAQWPHTRKAVEEMTGFEAKRAGDFASKVMQENKISWVSFRGHKMEYRSRGKGSFYQLIRKATEAKLNQNPRVRDVLMATRGLTLRPDHYQELDAPPAWKYYEIYMEIRDQSKDL